MVYYICLNEFIHIEVWGVYDTYKTYLISWKNSQNIGIKKGGLLRF